MFKNWFIAIIFISIALSVHSQGLGKWIYVNQTVFNFTPDTSILNCNSIGGIGYSQFSYFCGGSHQKYAGYFKPLNGYFYKYGGFSYCPNNGPKWIRAFVFRYTSITKQYAYLANYNSVNFFGFPQVKGNYYFKNVFGNVFQTYPGRRYSMATWVDKNDYAWLYGGIDDSGYHNDLWKYDAILNQWAWIQGDSTTGKMPVYGTKGIAAVNNTPGARSSNVTNWVDKQGNLWLFGGNINGLGLSNELWKYDISTNSWAWMSGSNILNDLGNYGIMGVASPTHQPPARDGYAASQDTAGNLLLFGGCNRNDVWIYDIKNNLWTWVAGSNQVNNTGVYSVYNGVGTPGARHEARAIQLNGTQNYLTYLFGGSDTSGTMCNNDLWLYNSNTNQFTWLYGDYNNPNNALGIYGTPNVWHNYNRTPGRYGHAIWITANNILYVCGGQRIIGPTRTDMWKYIPDSTSLILPNCQPTSFTQNITICKNDTLITSNFNPYYSSGVYYDTIINYRGCDSILTTHLTVINYQHKSIYDTICSNQSYSLRNGRKYNTTGIYYDTIPSATSCDSVYTLNLLVKAASFSNLSKTICSNQSYLFNNQTLTASGIYYDTLVNKNGCDSVISLQLVVNSVSNTSLNSVICSNQFYTLPNGLQVNKQGIYKDTLLNISGCDSFITINLSVIDLPQINLGSDTNLCAGNTIILSVPQYTAANYLWNNHTTNNAITVDTSGLYHVMIAMPPCASVADSITINFIDCDCKVLFPNSFTPNNDGIDETFKPIIACDVEPQQYEFKIYNRLGQKVFTTTLFGNAWDGIFNGAVQEIGTYVFFVSFIHPTTHQKEFYKGDVILLR